MPVALSKCRFVVLAVNVSTVYVALGLLLSLQPPFFPSEAEKKGATPSQYGFVFGIANLSLFLFSPVFGRYGTRIGAKTCFNTGSVLQGVSGFAFAFLPYIDSVGGFIGVSYLLRFLEGMGTAMAWSSALGILMELFPNKVGRVMSFTQTCFGLGYMLGPAVGAALYNIGGFMLPFLIVGSISTVLSLALMVTIPRLSHADHAPSEVVSSTASPTASPTAPVETAQEGEAANSISVATANGVAVANNANASNGHAANPNTRVLGLWNIVRSFSVLLPFIDLFAALCACGMLESMVEPHLREAGASTLDVGITFLIFGSTYMFGNMITGMAVDKLGVPIVFSIMGNGFYALAFCFIGPAPFLNIKPYLSLIQGMMVLAGFAYAMLVVSSFSRAQKRVIELGFPDDIHTHIVVSGVWMSAFALGNFVGPTVAGFVTEWKGFRTTTLSFLGLYVVMMVFDVSEAIYKAVKRRREVAYQLMN